MRAARRRGRTRARFATAPAAAVASSMIEGLESRLFLSSATAHKVSTTTTPTIPPPATGSISGTVFQDNSGNGAQDGGEPNISSPVVTVYLDLDNSNSLTGGDIQTTTSAGNYSFTGLADGTYSVGEVTPANYVRTNSAFLSATVSGGGAVSAKNFGNFPTVFTGTNGVDVYTVRIDASAGTKLQILETLNGGAQSTYSVTKSLLQTLTINTVASDDAFMVDYTNGNPIPSTGLNFDGGANGSTTGDRVTVTGTAGADTIAVYNADTSPGGGVMGVKNIEKVIINAGLGNDTLTLGPGINSDAGIDAGGNTDSLTITGTDNAEAYTISSASVFDGTFTTTISGLETLAINARGGADVGIFNDDASSPVTTLDMGDGDDNFTVNTANAVAMTVLGGNGNDQLAIGQGVSAPITFDAGAGANDRITVSASNGNDLIDVGATTVQRQGNPAVTFSNAEQLSIDAAVGTDIININAGSATLPITVLGGDGNDSLVVAAAALTSVNFDGGIGSNDATFNLTAGADNPVTIAANSVTNSAKSLTLATTQSLVINGLGGNDVFNVSGTASGTAVTVNGGDGNDTLNQNAAPGNTLVFNGGLTVTDQDTLNVNAGTYAFTADANVSSANLTLNAAAGATVTFGASQHLAALSVSGTATCSANGNRVLYTKSLGVSGKLNLCDNDLIVDYTGSSPIGTWNGVAYTGLTGRIAAGYHGGDWQGTSGIATNTADAFSGRTLIGIAEAFDVLGTSGSSTALFDGQTVDGTAVLIKYTYAGDYNLDGTVNGDDYFQIDSSFPQQLKTYFNGDLNYDGAITGDDYFYIDSTYPSQGAPL